MPYEEFVGIYLNSSRQNFRTAFPLMLAVGMIFAKEKPAEFFESLTNSAKMANYLKRQSQAEEHIQSKLHR